MVFHRYFVFSCQTGQIWHVSWWKCAGFRSRTLRLVGMDSSPFWPKVSEYTNNTNPTMPLFLIPQYTNQNWNVHILFQMVYCWIWNKWILVFVRLVYHNASTSKSIWVLSVLMSDKVCKNNLWCGIKTTTSSAKWCEIAPWRIRWHGFRLLNICQSA